MDMGENRNSAGKFEEQSKHEYDRQKFINQSWYLLSGTARVFLTGFRLELSELLGEIVRLFLVLERLLLRLVNSILQVGELGGERILDVGQILLHFGKLVVEVVLAGHLFLVLLVQGVQLLLVRLLQVFQLFVLGLDLGLFVANHLFLPLNGLLHALALLVLLVLVRLHVRLQVLLHLLHVVDLGLLLLEQVSSLLEL